MLAAASPYPLLDGSEQCGQLNAEAQQPEVGSKKAYGQILLTSLARGKSCN